MRPIERIDNFLEKVNWNDLLKKWGLEDAKTYIKLGTIGKITEYWKENPDQRIGQVLINLGIIPDGEAWGYEEYQILMDQGYPPEECLYWTSVFDAEGNLLEKPITRKVSELTKEHIRNIYKFAYEQRGYINMLYNMAFVNVLTK